MDYLVKIYNKLKVRHLSIEMSIGWVTYG